MQDDIAKILYSLLRNAPLIYFPIALLGGILILVVKSMFSSSYNTRQTEKRIKVINYLNQELSVKAENIEHIKSEVKNVRDYISKGMIEVGIEKLVEIKDILSNDANNFIELISSQIYNEKSKFNKGIVPNSDFSYLLNRINNSILEFMTKLEREIAEFEDNKEKKDDTDDEYTIPVSNNLSKNIFKNWHEKNFKYQVYFLTTLVLLGITSLLLLYYFSKLKETQKNSMSYHVENISYKIKNDSLSSKAKYLSDLARDNEKIIINLNNQIKINQEQLTELNSKILNDTPFEVEQIVFMNYDSTKSEDDKIIGYAFHKDSIKYVQPRIYVVPKIKTDKMCPEIFTNEMKVCDYSYYIKCKIHRKGIVDFNYKISPVGYTYRDVVRMNKSTREIDLGGWGSDMGNNYERGIYTFEIYYKDNLIGVEYFRIY